MNRSRSRLSVDSSPHDVSSSPAPRVAWSARSSPFWTAWNRASEASPADGNVFVSDGSATLDGGWPNTSTAATTAGIQARHRAREGARVTSVGVDIIRFSIFVLGLEASQRWPPPWPPPNPPPWNPPPNPPPREPPPKPPPRNPPKLDEPRMDWLLVVPPRSNPLKAPERPPAAPCGAANACCWAPPNPPPP